MRPIANYRQVFIDSLKNEVLVNPQDMNSGFKVGVPEEMKQLIADLKNGTLDFIDHEIYSNRSASGLQNVEFFLTDDNKSIGLRNLSKRQLDKGQFFLPVVVKLLAGDLGATPTDTLLRAEPYDDIFIAGGNLNSAELTIQVNGSTYMLKDSGTNEFATATSELGKGVKVVSNPKIIRPGLDIKAELKTGSAMATNLGVSLRLIGVMTTTRQ